MSGLHRGDPPEVPGPDSLHLVASSGGWTDEDEARWVAEEEARDARGAEAWRSPEESWRMAPEDNAVPERRTIDYDDGYGDGLRAGMGNWFLALLVGGLGGYVVRMVGGWLR
jgi:ferric-dicitrate binding protein FerR (iron transport regulator)